MTRAEGLHLLRTAKALEDMRPFLHTGLINMLIMHQFPFVSIIPHKMIWQYGGVIRVQFFHSCCFHIPSPLRAGLLHIFYYNCHTSQILLIDAYKTSRASSIKVRAARLK